MATYTISNMRDSTGHWGQDTHRITAACAADAHEEAEEWITDELEDARSAYEPGGQGFSVRVLYTLDGPDASEEECEVEVHIRPDTDELEARYLAENPGVADTECDHEWAPGDYDGDENSTWSVGGTAYKTTEHCRLCGLRRVTTSPGRQRNPGEAETVEYAAPLQR